MKTDEYIREVLGLVAQKIEQGRHKSTWTVCCGVRVVDNREQWRIEYEQHLANTQCASMSNYLESEKRLPAIEWGRLAQGALDATTITTSLIFLIYFAELVAAKVFFLK